MLEDQKKLDAVIFKNAGMAEYPLKSMKLSLLVEIGELCNQWKGFKHWKKHKEIDKEKLLDEFADCLHFGLSLENKLKQLEGTDFRIILPPINIVRDFISNCNEGDVNLMRICAFENAYKQCSTLENVVINILTVGAYLGITEEEMETSYYKKHRENYKRQEEGY